jgi:hypothetical protein
MGALVALIMIMGIAVPRPVSDLLTSATTLVNHAGPATALIDHGTISVAIQK